MGFPWPLMLWSMASEKDYMKSERWLSDELCGRGTPCCQQISKLQRSQNVFAEKMGRRLNIFRGDGKGRKRLANCDFNLRAFGKKRLMGCRVCLGHTFWLGLP